MKEQITDNRTTQNHTGDQAASAKTTSHLLQTTLPQSAKIKSTNAADQRHRILKRLSLAPATTIELREELDVLAPAPRIFELRHTDGYNIQSVRVIDETKPGHKHSVAQYALHMESSGDWIG